ncbi:hypothetical protein GF337_08165 [candidate division KSB1 bacterium]|nr:hypothetical protein [candidate division KSB1 bacterium]
MVRKPDECQIFDIFRGSIVHFRLIYFISNVTNIVIRCFFKNSCGDHAFDAFQNFRCN